MVPMQRVLKYHLLLQVREWGPRQGLGLCTSLSPRSGAELLPEAGL